MLAVCRFRRDCLQSQLDVNARLRTICRPIAASLTSGPCRTDSHREHSLFRDFLLPFAAALFRSAGIVRRELLAMLAALCVALSCAVAGAWQTPLGGYATQPYGAAPFGPQPMPTNAAPIMGPPAYVVPPPGYPAAPSFAPPAYGLQAPVPINAAPTYGPGITTLPAQVPPYGMSWQGPAVGPYGGQVIDDGLSPGGQAPVVAPAYGLGAPSYGPPIAAPPARIQPYGLGPAPATDVPFSIYPLFGIGPPAGGPPDPRDAQYYDPFGSQFTYGLAGVQPYQYGWLSYNDFVYLPTSGVKGVPGTMEIFEWNTWLRYSHRVGENLLFSWTPELNVEWWRPPSTLGLPHMVNELKSDFKLASVNATPWNWQIGFTPQLNSDFRRTLTHDAYMFDGRGVLLYKACPQLTVALGIQYWDRIHGYLLPYGGLIWTPNDRWEFRLLFPQARISYYMGRFHSFDVWAYASGEYQIEAYQIDTDAGVVERGQWQDYQLLFGFDANLGRFSGFIQGGWIFDRHVMFNGPTPGFGLGDSLMLRTGLLF